VVASRLHGIILTHLLGKPALAISYDRKVRAHAEDMGQERFCVDLRGCTSQQLMDSFGKLGSEGDKISVTIRAKVKDTVRLACRHGLRGVIAGMQGEE
jgi:polysaccharide pyruvyl transferase WcaK-like protein